MGIYYVDLSREGSGYAGTKLDPFSYLDYKSVSSTVNDEFYLKGKYVLPDLNSFSIAKGNHYGWDIVTNGPWRIKGSEANIIIGGSSRIVKDAIFDIGYLRFYFLNSNTELNNIKIRNSYFRVTKGFLCYKEVIGGFTVNFEGCTIIRTGGYFDAEGSITPLYYNFKDCVLLSVTNPISFNSAITPNFINCATDSITLPGAKQNCEEGSTISWHKNPEQEPLWDAPKEKFDNNILYGTIGTPPQPGNPPYTEYETDLFGNPRTGIGAGYMYEESEEIVKKEISKYRIDNVYFNVHNLGNSYFSEIFKGKIENYSIVNNIKEMSKEITNPSKDLDYDLSSVSKLPWIKGK